MTIDAQFGVTQQELFALDLNATTLLFGPGIYALIPALFPAATTSGSEVESELAVPAGAVVSQAVVRVTASAPKRTPINGVATVRASSGDPEAPSSSMIIDFGVMRNVSSLEGPAAIYRVAPWLGTSFDEGGYREGGDSIDFQELQTERLLVEFSEVVSAAALAAMHITTSTPPADLDLLVGGTRAWFRQGAVPTDFTEEVDITAAVQAAVSSGISPVPVLLKTRVPGHLELNPVGPVQFLRTHVVQFPQGATTVADAAEEGIVDIALPLPVDSATWKIHRIVSTIVAEDRGPHRVVPPVGPTELVEAELTLDADRRLVVRLATGAWAPFASLAAVRVRLTPGVGGIGVVGGLLGGSTLAPGEALPGGEITEVAVEPSATARWVTLPFAKPIALPVTEQLWLSIAATHGKALLGLRAVDPTSTLNSTDDEQGIASIRRIAPNGIARPMSAPLGLRTDALALRLIGTAPDGQPIDLVSVGLASRLPDSSVSEVGTVAEPGDGPDRHVRALLTPGPIANPQLRATVTGPTRLTVGPVLVAYQE